MSTAAALRTALEAVGVDFIIAAVQTTAIDQAAGTSPRIGRSVLSPTRRPPSDGGGLTCASLCLVHVGRYFPAKTLDL